jgi:hypothetical protein
MWLHWPAALPAHATPPAHHKAEPSSRNDKGGFLWNLATIHGSGKGRFEITRKLAVSQSDGHNAAELVM